MDDLSFLPTVLWVLVAAVFVVAIFRRFHLSPVLGYFVAGAAIGEYGLKFVRAEDTEVFGEFGVVFLLFAIGLELTFERLKSMRLHVFGFGGLQVVLTALTLCLLALYVYNIKPTAAIVIGGGFALSSTAIILQVIAEGRKQSTQVGRLSLAVLLMQDFAVIPLLVLIPLLAGNGESSSIGELMGMALLKAVATLLIIFVLGRLFLRPIFRAINPSNQSKSNEIFVATTLVIVLASAWATEHMGLSLALGAFVAGLLVAETEYHLQAEESIAPFKGLLLGLFFMTVGMKLNMQLIIQELNIILILSFGLIVIKSLIMGILCRFFKFNWGTTIHASLLLSQSSEFSFILFGLAVSQGIISQSAGQILMIVVTVTMALTPLLSMLGDFIADKLDKKERMDYSEINRDVADLSQHVIIAGFGRVGKMVALLLEAEKINYIALDASSTHVAHERRDGFPLYLGDASNISILESVGLSRAKSVIITIDNEITSKKCTKVIRQHMPKIPIVVRAKDLSKAEELYKNGVSMIVPETYETGLQMGGAVLKSVGISEFEVSRIKNRFRLGNYVIAQDEEDEETLDEII